MSERREVRLLRLRAGRRIAAAALCARHAARCLPVSGDTATLGLIIDVSAMGVSWAWTHNSISDRASGDRSDTSVASRFVSGSDASGASPDTAVSSRRTADGIRAALLAGSRIWRVRRAWEITARDPSRPVEQLRMVVVRLNGQAVPGSAAGRVLRARAANRT